MPTTQYQPSGRENAARNAEHADKEAATGNATHADERAPNDPAAHGQDPDSIVTEASEESFPASDAPAWTSRRDETVLG